MRRATYRVSRFSVALGGVIAVVGLWGVASAAQRTGADSGLPVPRYESIASAEAYGRRGPGMDHRIDWVYRARGLPVRVVQEFDVWRKIRDPSGGEAWMHSTLLSPNRTILIKEARRPGVALRQSPDPSAKPRAWLASGVVAVLRQCEGEWRRVAVPGKAEGWIPASAAWGAEDCRLPR